MKEESKDLMDLIDLDITNKEVEKTKVPHSSFFSKSRAISKALKSEKSTGKRRFLYMAKRFSAIPICIILIFAFTFTLFQTGTVYISHADSPNPDFSTMKMDIMDILYDSNSYCMNLRKELINEFHMPMEMYAKLDNCFVEYDLYYHQHWHQCNSDVETAQREITQNGHYDVSPDDIQAYYDKEYNDKDAEMEQKIKDILGNRYNDFTNWYVEEDVSQGIRQGFTIHTEDNAKPKTEEENKAEEARLKHLEENQKFADEQHAKFQPLFDYACEKASLTDYEKVTAWHLFTDMECIYSGAYSANDRRVSEQGKSKEKVSIKCRDQFIKDFEASIPIQLKERLGDKYEAFAPYVTDLISYSEYE